MESEVGAPQGCGRFYGRSQTAAKYSEFGENKDKEIKSQIELETTSMKRRHLFGTPTLPLINRTIRQR